MLAQGLAHAEGQTVTLAQLAAELTKERPELRDMLSDELDRP